MEKDEYVASVIMNGQAFVSPHYAACDGSVVPIVDYSVYFTVVGTLYGGDGRSSVGLPNLNGRTPLGVGQGPGLTPRPMGQSGGDASPEITVTEQNLPEHTHTADFYVASLSANISPDLSNASVSGTLPCKSGPGGSAMPVNGIPGGSANVPWSQTQDSTMAYDVLSGNIKVNGISTQFDSATINVTIASNGSTPTPIPIGADAPTQTVPFQICLTGVLPPRNQ